MLQHHTVKRARSERHLLRNTLTYARMFVLGYAQGCQVDRAKFCALALNICGPSVWNLSCVTLVGPRILRWLLDFGKNCTPSCKRTKFYLLMEHPCWCNIHNACRCFQSHRILFVIVRCLTASFEPQYRPSSGHLYKNRTRFGGILW